MSYGNNEGSDGHTRLDQLENAAAQRKCSIVLPQPNELQIDIDSEEQLERFLSIVNNQKVRKLIGVLSHSRWKSPSGKPGRYHAKVKLENPVEDDAHRVFLQGVLHSDPVRELLAWKRIDNGVAPVSCFFEKLPHDVIEE